MLVGKKVISVNLSDVSINKAIRELELYKKELIEKTTLLQKRIGKRIEELAQNGFNGAIVDDLLEGSPKIASVEVLSMTTDDTTIVIAKGEDAVWVEFGAGVHHNKSFTHPNGAELGLTIGSFGSNGKKEVWGFYKDGKLKLSHGTPGKMPLANAVTAVCNEIVEIAKEVFN